MTLFSQQTGLVRTGASSAKLTLILNMLSFITSIATIPTMSQITSQQRIKAATSATTNTIVRGVNKRKNVFVKDGVLQSTEPKEVPLQKGTTRSDARMGTGRKQNFVLSNMKKSGRSVFESMAFSQLPMMIVDAPRAVLRSNLLDADGVMQMPRFTFFASSHKHGHEIQRLNQKPFAGLAATMFERPRQSQTLRAKVASFGWAVNELSSAA